MNEHGFLIGYFPDSPLCLFAYCRSYSPLPTRFRTVNPDFLASETERGFNLTGELKFEKTLRTGFLQAGHLVSAGALIGRRKVNLPLHTAQSPSHSSYS